MANLDASTLIKILQTLTESMSSIESIINQLDRKVDALPRQDILIQKLENIELKFKQTIQDIMNLTKNDLSQSINNAILKVESSSFKKLDENEAKIIITEKENKSKVQLGMINLISAIVTALITAMITYYVTKGQNVKIDNVKTTKQIQIK
jgi:hypothetical protein